MTKRLKYKEAELLSIKVKVREKGGSGQTVEIWHTDLYVIIKNAKLWLRYKARGEDDLMILLPEKKEEDEKTS